MMKVLFSPFAHLGIKIKCVLNIRLSPNMLPVAYRLIFHCNRERRRLARHIISSSEFVVIFQANCLLFKKEHGIVPCFSFL